MKEYHYFLRMRPPAPGAVPREGLLRCTDREIFYDGQRYWGEAVYNRQLTTEEVEHYELSYHKTRTLSAE